MPTKMPNFGSMPSLPEEPIATQLKELPVAQILVLLFIFLGLAIWGAFEIIHLVSSSRHLPVISICIGVCIDALWILLAIDQIFHPSKSANAKANCNQSRAWRKSCMVLCFGSAILPWSLLHLSFEVRLIGYFSWIGGASYIVGTFAARVKNAMTTNR